MQWQFKTFLGIAGGYLSYVLGGFDILIRTLITLVVIDYITGVIAAAYQGNISSYKGFKGIIKKVIIFSIICLANLAGNALRNEFIRNFTVIFYITNEGISILENAIKCDVPIPNKLKSILQVIQSKDNPDTTKNKQLDTSDIAGNDDIVIADGGGESDD